jgi:hypothetical protein
MPQSRFGQIIAQGKAAFIPWQVVRLRDGGEMRFEGPSTFEYATLGDIVRMEYLATRAQGWWQIVERLSRIGNAVDVKYCRFCNEAYCVHCLPPGGCEIDGGCQLNCCAKCRVTSSVDPNVQACPDHIEALNAQMERDRRAA